MELLDLGRKPVSDAKPAGDDARYEPEYDLLQQEIDKLASATAGGGVDWKKVVKLSSSILKDKSKDLKVASYLGVGLLHLKGVEGLSAGAQILLDLVMNFWDTLYPAKKRMRGRFGAISWWGENGEKFLKDYGGDELRKEVAELLAKRVDALDAALAEKSDDAPILRDLSGYVQRLPVEAPPEPEQTSVSDESGISAAAESSSPVSAAPLPKAGVSVGDINSPEECAAGIKAALSSFVPVSEYLLSTDLTDAIGYRLRRMSAWMPVVSLPPAENGRTMIPDPEGSIKDSIASRLASGDFSGALLEAESRIGEYLFWLDLSRMSAEALKGMGDGYADALAALELETQFYVQRLPGISGLSFAEGTPFADPRTRSWLQSLGKVSDGGVYSGSGSDEVAEIMVKAEQLAANKKILEAVAIICDTLNTSPSLRSAFRLRTGLTGLLTAEGQAGVAHVHAAALLEQIESCNLEQWEPELALSGLQAAYGAVIAEGGADSEAKSVEILQRIIRLSPVEGLKINGFN
ncbi:type VI secretion system protein TssA [Maridesulfovibrio sp.]|uniref:type VI secretion system protein TssA n=1 Tax=Maridesulfovibrio sp. TaxID=2795000 RepID=UPI0029C9B870|nr:type VI secretion system protein TssA [Maridesulfovibrio sp.]